MRTQLTMLTARSAVLIAAAAGLSGCLHAKVDPIEVKPITINVNVRIQRELDQFFSFEDKLLTGDGGAAKPASTQPAPNTQK